MHRFDIFALIRHARQCLFLKKSISKTTILNSDCRFSAIGRSTVPRQPKCSFLGNLRCSIPGHSSCASTIGEDSRIFDLDEEPTPAGLFEKLSRNPDDLEEESFLTQAKREWEDICKNYPAVAEKVHRLPGRVKTTQLKTPLGVYLFARKGMTLFALLSSEDETTDDGIVHLSIQEAITAIRCPFETKRCDDFSPDFWDNYEAIQQSLFDRRNSAPPGANSLITKARNVLVSAISNGIGGEFTKTLLDDLQNHGTLSERTLRKIIGDRNIAPEKAIQQLKLEMGADYLSIIKDKLPLSEIVIAIEHQD